MLPVWPPTVTTILWSPAASAGTTKVIEVVDQAVAVTATPPMVIVLPVGVVPKLVPETVIEVAVVPADGETVPRVGVTVKFAPALTTPLTVTMNDEAPARTEDGMVTVIEPSDQADGDSVTPFNVNVLVPCGEPKLVPVNVTTVVALPVDTLSPEM